MNNLHSNVELNVTYKTTTNKFRSFPSRKEKKKMLKYI